MANKISSYLYEVLGTLPDGKDATFYSDKCGRTRTKTHESQVIIIVMTNFPHYFTVSAIRFKFPATHTLVCQTESEINVL